MEFFKKQEHKYELVTAMTLFFAGVMLGEYDLFIMSMILVSIRDVKMYMDKKCNSKCKR